MNGMGKEENERDGQLGVNGWIGGEGQGCEGIGKKLEKRKESEKT